MRPPASCAKIGVATAVETTIAPRILRPVIRFSPFCRGRNLSSEGRSGPSSEREIGGLGTARRDLRGVAESALSAKLVVPVERIELPTFGLQNRCSTAELNRPTHSIDARKFRHCLPPIVPEGAGGPSNTRVVRRGLQVKAALAGVSAGGGYRTLLVSAKRWSRCRIGGVDSMAWEGGCYPRRRRPARADGCFTNLSRRRRAAASGFRAAGLPVPLASRQAGPGR
jgi:hypothetical protein